MQEVNLTLHNENLAGEKTNELSFKGSLVAERKYGPKLWALMLTLPHNYMQNALMDNALQ